MATNANEEKSEKVLDTVKNWSMGSKAMSREKFLATLDFVIEGLEEMRDEAEGWDFDREEEE